MLILVNKVLKKTFQAERDLKMTAFLLSIMLGIVSLCKAENCSVGVLRCMWEPWNPWGSCSESCGTGIATRTRGLCCKERQEFNACVKECGVTNSAFGIKPCNVSCYGESQTSMKSTYTLPIVQTTREISRVTTEIISTTTATHSSLSTSRAREESTYTSIAPDTTEIPKVTNKITSDTTLSNLTNSKASTHSNATRSNILTYKTTATFAVNESIGASSTSTNAAAATTTEYPLTTSSTNKLPTTSASCVAKIADVVFVIDSSGSIGAENFKKLKEFMKDVVRTFDINIRYTRVAVIKYNDYPNIEFKLTNYTNINELLEAINDIKYTVGGTNTADALQLMRLEGFDRERPAAPNIGIVITDGLSKYPTVTKAQADMAKKDGITLFAIGIGNETQKDELNNIASGDRVYQVEGFDSLETINSAVAHMTCGVNLDESFATKSTTSPRTTPSGCADYDDNCGSYGRDSCYDYEPFARGHCPKSCGFCRDANANTTNVCADAVGNCAQYGVEMCYKESQHDWVQANCPKFCGFCGEKHAPLPTTPITTIATTKVLCEDSISNCHEYGGPGMCQTYGQWARQNCAKYCGVCFNYVQVTAVTIGNKRCPAWKIPEACTLEPVQGQCCPSLRCPDGFILSVLRH